MPKKKKKGGFKIPAGRRFSRRTVIDGLGIGGVVEKYAGDLAVPLSLLSMVKGVDSSVKTAGHKIAVDHLLGKYLP